MGVQESITKRSYAKMFDSFTYTPITIERNQENKSIFENINSAPLLKTAYHGIWSMVFPKNNGPISRIRHCGNYYPDRNSIIIAYGSDVNNQSLNDCWELDLNELIWKNISNCLSTPRHSTSSCIINDKIFFFGGYNEHNFFSDLHFLDLNTGNVIFLKTEGISPSPRACPVIHLINNNEILIWGGYGNENDDYIYYYNLNYNNWNLSNIKFTSRSSPSFYSFKNKLFIFGSSKSYGLLEYNEENKTIYHIDCSGVEPPSDLTRSSLILADEYLFLIGGESNNQFMHIYAYDIKRKWWFAFHVRPDKISLSITDGFINDLGLFMLPREFSSTIIYNPNNRELISILGSRMMDPQPIFKIEIGEALSVLHLRSDLLECFHNSNF